MLYRQTMQYIEKKGLELKEMQGDVDADCLFKSINNIVQ